MFNKLINVIAFELIARSDGLDRCTGLDSVYNLGIRDIDDIGVVIRGRTWWWL